MTSIRKLLSALCLASCYSAFSNAQVLDPTQVYTTPNIVQPTVAGTNSTPWVNGVYQDELTCWAFGLFGYCGPNPIVRPDGNINFSYGWTDLHQQQNIANVLPYSGTGLRVNGYNFGFTAKNGNGWDDGRTDLLYAYVQFNSPTGTSLLNHTHNLSYQFDWTNFNYNHTFTTPYASADLGSVRYGFVGKDNNFWAGPYGPEINNVSFSLKYSVDPCYVNVLSSPSCPGYLEELAKFNTAPTVTSTPVTQTTTQTVEQVATPQITPQVTPQVELPQTIVAAPQVQPQTSGSKVSLSNILGIVSAEQSRISNLERSTVQSSVEQSIREAEKATQKAESVAASSTNESISVSVSSAQSQMAIDQQQILSSQSSGGGLGFFSGNLFSLLQSDFSAARSSNAQQNVIEDKVASAVSFSGFSAVNAIERKDSKPEQENQTKQKDDTVKQNTPNNELAGNITISSLGGQPIGFNYYLTGMPDGTLYVPKEIYKEQKVIDNPSGRRLFSGTDNLHQRMVDQQYK